MSEFSIPVKLVKWIIQHIDPLFREFRHDGKVIIFDRPLVCKILGFENGTKPLDLSIDIERVDEFLKIRDQYRDGNMAKLKRWILRPWRRASYSATSDGWHIPCSLPLKRRGQP
jgi:hypothetical protein